MRLKVLFSLMVMAFLVIACAPAETDGGPDTGDDDEGHEHGVDDVHDDDIVDSGDDEGEDLDLIDDEEIDVGELI